MNRLIQKWILLKVVHDQPKRAISSSGRDILISSVLRKLAWKMYIKSIKIKANGQPPIQHQEPNRHLVKGLFLMNHHFMLKPSQSQGHMNNSFRLLWWFLLGIYISLHPSSQRLSVFTSNLPMRVETPRESQECTEESEVMSRTLGKVGR